MKLINAISGKIGTCVIGPKYYLKEMINLGEMAICIARDERHARPSVWLIGGLEQLIDYVSLARSKGELEDDISSALLKKIDEAKKSIPSSAVERLASAIGMPLEELQEIINVAQVCVSAPIEGIRDFSGKKPQWLPKSINYAPIH